MRRNWLPTMCQLHKFWKWRLFTLFSLATKKCVWVRFWSAFFLFAIACREGLRKPDHHSILLLNFSSHVSTCGSTGDVSFAIVEIRLSKYYKFSINDSHPIKRNLICRAYWSGAYPEVQVLSLTVTSQCQATLGTQRLRQDVWCFKKRANHRLKILSCKRSFVPFTLKRKLLLETHSKAIQELIFEDTIVSILILIKMFLDA